MDGGARFEISAKVPPDTTKEQFRVMLQNLLAERFRLVIHREKKEMQVYNLLVAKGGLKVKELVEDPSEDSFDDGIPSLGRGGRPDLGKDGFYMVPKWCKGCILVAEGDKARIYAETMQQLASVLSDELEKPVLDATGLKGKYDVSVSFERSTRQGRGMLAGVPPGPGTDADVGAPSDVGFGVPLGVAIQAQLGLKLEQMRGAVEIIVVDHAEKVPTEN